jgi:hypothetical protein
MKGKSEIPRVFTPRNVRRHAFLTTIRRLKVRSDDSAAVPFPRSSDAGGHGKIPSMVVIAALSGSFHADILQVKEIQKGDGKPVLIFRFAHFLRQYT